MSQAISARRGDWPPSPRHPIVPGHVHALLTRLADGADARRCAVAAGYGEAQILVSAAPHEVLVRVCAPAGLRADLLAAVASWVPADAQRTPAHGVLACVGRHGRSQVSVTWRWSWS